MKNPRIVLVSAILFGLSNQALALSQPSDFAGSDDSSIGSWTWDPTQEVQEPSALQIAGDIDRSNSSGKNACAAEYQRYLACLDRMRFDRALNCFYTCTVTPSVEPYGRQ